MIKENKVNLVPASLDDKKSVYEWCFHSETTKSHSGPPDYSGVPIITADEFFDDYHYQECYFTGSSPGHGSGFIIMHDGEAVGFISYSCFHLKKCIAELDIWLNSEANCGKGFGTAAVVALGEYLKNTLNIGTLIMRPSIKNERANKSYEKAGFTVSNKRPEEYLLKEYLPVYGDGDYGEDETVLLVKSLGAGKVKDIR